MTRPAPESSGGTPGIGLLNEKHLHASLKAWCARPGDRLETNVDGFVIDIVRGDLLLEIQTRNFSAIKTKLMRLAESHPIRVIHPIAREKWIVKRAKKRGRAVRRKSPRTGRVEDLFWEVVSVPQLLSHPNFSIEVLLIKEEETRRHDGRRGWRRKGWVTEERRLLEVVEHRLLEKPDDWLGLLPEGLESFTVADLARAGGIRANLAQKMAYCLRKAGFIHLAGKRGRAYLYSVGIQ